MTDSAMKTCPTCAATYPAGERFCPKDGAALLAQSGAELIGSVIAERYHVLRKLGEGAMGQVYLAEHVKMGRKSALKVMHPGTNADVDAISRFNREAANASRITHPNVAAVYDFGEMADGMLFLAMEFIEGESLTSLLDREGPLTPARAAELTRQIAEGLAAAHEMDIVHRDLKPDNIMVTKSRSGAELVKVVDFGIAKAMGADDQKVTRTGLSVGTPEYMSPEQFAADRIEHTSDIYSLGLVAFGMFTGQLPFQGGSVQETMILRLTEEPATLAEVRPEIAWPPTVLDVMKRALARDSAERIQSASEFGEVLVEAVALMPESVRGAIPAPRSSAIRTSSTHSAVLREPLPAVVGVAPPPPRRRWAARIGVGAAVAIAVTVGAVLFTRTPAMAEPRLAVLPFENRSRDSADAYLGEAVAEEIGARVAQVPRVVVLSNTAVRRLAGRDTMGVEEIGRRLGAGYLLSGRAERTGGRLRVAVELTRVSNGELAWSNQFDRAESELPVLIRDIAIGVASGMIGSLSPEIQARLTAPTENAAAYDLYLRGSQTRLSEGAEGLQQSIASFDAALALDPRFAAAEGRLAAVYSRALFWNVSLPGMTVDTIARRAEAAAKRALALDSASADAWAGWGIVQFLDASPDLAGAVTSFGRAAALDSMNAVVHWQRAQVLRRLGDFPGAVAGTRRALAIDPQMANAYNQLALIAYSERDFRLASALGDSAIALAPEEWQFWAARARVYISLGDTARARADAERALQVSPPAQRFYAELIVAQAEALAGDSVRARARIAPGLDRLPARGALNPRNYQIAIALIATGSPTAALDLLERIEPRSAWLWSYLIMPAFDPVRADPRFVRLVDQSRPPGSSRP